MVRRTRQELERFIKKPFIGFANEVESLYTNIDVLEVDKKDLKDEVDQLKRKIAQLERDLKEARPAIAVAESMLQYIQQRQGSPLTVLDVRQQVREVIDKDLEVEVEGYYEEYSGQHEHYHRATVSLRQE